MSIPLFGLLFYFYHQKPIGHERKCAKLAIGFWLAGVALLPINVDIAYVHGYNFPNGFIWFVKPIESRPYVDIGKIVAENAANHRRIMRLLIGTNMEPIHLHLMAPLN